MANTPSEEQIQEAEQLIEAERRTGKKLDDATSMVKLTRSDIPDDALMEAKKEIRAKSFDDSEVVQVAISNVAPFLELNPRKIKRFINMFRLQALIANRRGLLDSSAVKLDVLARWIVISSRWPMVVDALLADEFFIDRLRKARKILETIRREQLSSESVNQSEAQRAQPYDEKFYQMKLAAYTVDPNIKLLVDAPDLANLLNQLTDTDIQSLSIYLHLTQITSQTS